MKPANPTMPDMPMKPTAPTPMPMRDPSNAKQEGNEHRDDGKVRDAMKGGMGKGGAKPCPSAP